VSYSREHRTSRESIKENHFHFIHERGFRQPEIRGVLRRPRSARINSHRRRFDRRRVGGLRGPELEARERSHAYRRRVPYAWHAPLMLCGPHERGIKWNRGATLSRGPLRSQSRLHAKLIHPVSNSAPARSPRGIGLINSNRNLLSQSASTSRSQITRPMNLEPRANYMKNLFLSVCSRDCK